MDILHHQTFALKLTSNEKNNVFQKRNLLNVSHVETENKF